jgi:hypothetical protein
MANGLAQPRRFSTDGGAGSSAIDAFDSLIAAIIEEAAELEVSERAELAERILTLGGYESVDDLVHGNARARLALRLAARFSATN